MNRAGDRHICVVPTCRDASVTEHGLRGENIPTSAADNTKCEDLTVLGTIEVTVEMADAVLMRDEEHLSMGHDPVLRSHARRMCCWANLPNRSTRSSKACLSH